MTSFAEGFGLGVSESVCNGCPAMAFDIKYGPSDIIKDGETGFLIPRFDKNLYASKLTELLKDVELQRTMSENCYADAERFGTEAFLESWRGMTEYLRGKAKHNI
jgi:poly(glycerol-phosphate) alpha-glucosyltransferase